MSSVVSKKKDYTQGKVLKKLVLFALPLGLATFVQKLFHAADVAVIGQFAGPIYQSAITATGTISSLLVNFFVGFSLGVNVAVANAQGAKDDKKKEEAIHTGIGLSLIAGVLVTVLGVALSRPFLILLKTPESLLDLATSYLIIIFLGKPATLVYNFGAAIFRGVGESKRPLFYLTLAGILNIIINVITVVFFHWHVIGVALGTIISMYVAAGWVLIDLMRGKAGVKFSFKKLKLDKLQTKKILGIGFPMAINNSLFSVSNMLVASNLNAFGEFAIAGKGVAANLEEILETFGSAISSGVVTFVGQNIGAKKEYRINRIIGAAMVALTAWYAFVIGFILLFGKYFCMIFSSDGEVISWAMRRIMIMDIFTFLTMGSKAFGGALRGMGKTMFTMICNIFFTCVLRVGYLSFIYPLLPQTFECMYIIYPITWLMSAVAQVAVYLVLAIKKGFFKKPKEEKLSENLSA